MEISLSSVTPTLSGGEPVIIVASAANKGSKDIRIFTPGTVLDNHPTNSLDVKHSVNNLVWLPVAYKGPSVSDFISLLSPMPDNTACQ
jgi:hypothetical protein